MKEKINKKNICFFDCYSKIVSNINAKDFFDSVYYLKAYEENASSEQQQNEEYYKYIFNKYTNDDFSNDREKLSFNFDKYSHQYKSLFEFKYYNTSFRDKLFDSLQDFIYSEKNYLAFTGVSGTGKTISLLKYLREISKTHQNCYFNIKYLRNLSNIRILANEIVKLFHKKSLDSYIELIHQIENKNNFLI